MLVKGESIALFGEKRIGKTLTLFLIRDIINRSIHKYKHDIYDKELVAWLDSFKVDCSTSEQFFTECKYFDLQSLGERSDKAISLAIHNMFFQSSDVEEFSLTQLFVKIDKHIKKRVLLIFDEMDEVLEPDFEGAEIVLNQLRHAIQSCPNISFVFAGAEYWVNNVTRRASPLYGNCNTYFLSTPDSEMVRQYLLNIPLKMFITSDKKRIHIVNKIMQFTSGKALYCQIIASEIAKGRHLKEAIMNLYDNQSTILRDFFKNLPEPRPMILACLAHRHYLSKQKLSRILGISNQSLSSLLREMTLLGKIRFGKRGYALNGDLFEEWGKDNIEMPQAKSFGQKCLKPFITIILLTLAFVIYLYTHPEIIEKKFLTKRATIVIEMPSNVERGESGNGCLYIIAGESDIDELIIYPHPGSIMFWPLKGNVVTFSNIKPHSVSEKKDINYTVSDDVKQQEALLKLSLETAEVVVFNFSVRLFSLKKFWAILTGLATIIAAFFNTEFFLKSYGLMFGRKQKSEKNGGKL